MATTKKAFKTIPAGTSVTWHYRSAIGHGTVVGVQKMGTKADNTMSAADANHDGVIDLIETGAAAGTTMVPFNADPVRMHVASDTYPKASADGSYNYRKTVSLKAMTAAFAKAFGDPDLALDRRVVFVHGIAPTAALAGSVASLGTIPGQVTLPIACGKIERVAR